MMWAMGFESSFVDLIKRCISTVTYQVLVNGKPTSSIVPQRGLCKGDPISPFLFLMCVEGLSILIRDREEKKMIYGIKVARSVPMITHLFFVEDSLLFIRATQDEAESPTNSSPV